MTEFPTYRAKPRLKLFDRAGTARPWRPTQQGPVGHGRGWLSRVMLWALVLVATANAVSCTTWAETLSARPETEAMRGVALAWGEYTRARGLDTGRTALRQAWMSRRSLGWTDLIGDRDPVTGRRPERTAADPRR